jgi:hypothetical protein
MARSSRFLVVALAAGVLAASPALATMTVGFDPANKVVLGTGPAFDFTMDVVADIPQADALAGWGFDTYVVNDAVVQIIGYTINATDWQEVAAASPDPNDPTVDLNLEAVTNASAPSDGIWGTGKVLVTLNLRPLAYGDTDLTLGDHNAEGDLNEGFAFDPPPTGYADVTYTIGHVTVIPEPASIALLALGAFALIRRR